MSKTFSKKINYLKCYVQDMYTNLSVTATMPPIMIRPNVILKSKFMNISRHFPSYWLKGENWQNKLTAIQEHPSFCNDSRSFDNFSVLTKESNDFKLKIMDNIFNIRSGYVNTSTAILIIYFGGYNKFYHIIGRPSSHWIQMSFAQFSILC